MGHVFSGATPVRRYRITKRPDDYQDIIDKNPFVPLPDEGEAVRSVGFQTADDGQGQNPNALPFELGDGIHVFRVCVHSRQAVGKAERERRIQELMDSGSTWSDAKSEVENQLANLPKIPHLKTFDAVIREDWLYVLHNDPGAMMEPLRQIGFECEPVFPWTFMPDLTWPHKKLDAGSFHGANLARSILWTMDPIVICNGKLTILAEDGGLQELGVKGGNVHLLTELREGQYTRGLITLATLAFPPSRQVRWNFLMHSIASCNPQSNAKDSDQRVCDRINGFEDVIKNLDDAWERYEAETDEDRENRGYLLPGPTQEALPIAGDPETEFEPDACETAVCERPVGEPAKPLVSAAESEEMLEPVAAEFEPVGKPKRGIFGRIFNRGGAA